MKIFLLLLAATTALAQPCRIVVDKDPAFPTYARITFENNLFKAVIRSSVGDDGFVENGFRDWILKENGSDQIEFLADACAMRPAISKTTLIKNTPSEKAIQVRYGTDQYVSVYTIYANRPYLKVDYLKYDEANGHGWHNNVDVLLSYKDEGSTVTTVYGQERHVRGRVLYEDVYWNAFKEGDKPTDPADGGALNYKNHLIMAVSNKHTLNGFCRVLPIYRPGVRGGTKVLKLLWNQGFENFPATGEPATEHLPYTGYLFAFHKKPEAAIADAQRIIDQQPAPFGTVSTTANSIETDQFRVQYGDAGKFWGPGITNFTYKPQGVNYGYTLDAIGRGYAKYARKKPALFTVTAQTDSLLEVRSTFTDSVDVLKYNRFLKGYPIMEIHYERFGALWWEDYFDNPDTSVVLSLLTRKELTRNAWWEARRKAEATCKHNFGDCFLNALGSHVRDFTYKGFFIYGVHAKSNGRGIGGILSLTTPLHDNWKPWWEDRPITNFEGFPFGLTPFSRWVFIYENGNGGMEATAKKLIDELIITGRLRKE
jgi:hypothetical protein